MSVDVDATIAKQNMNVTESVLDGKNMQVRDVSASLTSSTQDTTVSHFNASRKDIKIDGQKYRCNKVMVRGERKILFMSSICNVGWLWIKPMVLSGSLTMK